MTRFLATANPGFAPYAMEELRRRWPSAAMNGIAAGETFLLDPGVADTGQWLAAIRQDEPVFTRHLFPVEAEFAAGGDAGRTADDLAAYARTLASRVNGGKTAVQVRKEQGSPFPFTSAEGRDVIAAVVRELGGEVTAEGADWIVSVYAARKTVYAGCSRPADNLSDWPGGNVRFRRDESLISRAAFKLLEAEKAFGLPLAGFSHALDLGAAPGGWTSVLLERGLKVTAVDPAQMDPRVIGHPNLRHIGRNAAETTFPPGSFDLLVCDMSWDPHHTCRIVSDLAPALRKGASGIITLKLMYRKPLQSIRTLRDEYAQTFDIMRIKQLFHNREEVTMWVMNR